MDHWRAFVQAFPCKFGKGLGIWPGIGQFFKKLEINILFWPTLQWPAILDSPKTIAIVWPLEFAIQGGQIGWGNTPVDEGILHKLCPFPSFWDKQYSKCRFQLNCNVNIDTDHAQCWWYGPFIIGEKEFVGLISIHSFEWGFGRVKDILRKKGWNANKNTGRGWKKEGCILL